MELSSPQEDLIALSGFMMNKQEVWSLSLKVVELVSQVIPIESSASSSTKKIQTWLFLEVGITTSKSGISDNPILADPSMDHMFVEIQSIYTMAIY